MNDASEFIMPWGKYKGQALCDIPSGYLQWLRGGGSKDMPVDDGLAELAEEEYFFRSQWNTHFWE